MLPWRWWMISRHWSIAVRSVYKSLFIPQRIILTLFFSSTFPLRSSPLVINLHMPSGRLYLVLLQESGLDVSHCLQCRNAATSVCCGQPRYRLHVVGSVVEDTVGQLLGCKTVLSWQCCGSQIHYKAWFINPSSLLKSRPLVWPLYA